VLKLLENYSEEETKQILQKMKMKKLYYTMYHDVVKFSQWMKAIYQPDIQLNKTHLGTVAYSALNFAKRLEQQAQEIIDILEKE
jgi:hypothetical protein